MATQLENIITQFANEQDKLEQMQGQRLKLVNEQGQLRAELSRTGDDVEAEVEKIQRVTAGIEARDRVIAALDAKIQAQQETLRQTAEMLRRAKVEALRPAEQEAAKAVLDAFVTLRTALQDLKEVGEDIRALQGSPGHFVHVQFNRGVELQTSMFVNSPLATKAQRNTLQNIGQSKAAQRQREQWDNFKWPVVGIDFEKNANNPLLQAGPVRTK